MLSFGAAMPTSPKPTMVSISHIVSIQMRASEFPFIVFSGLSNSKIVPLHVFKGPWSVQTAIEIMDKCIDNSRAEVAAARSLRAERDFSRSIREQQDAAYRESLRKDQEKVSKLYVAAAQIRS
jgi:FAS-associated factor 2